MSQRIAVGARRGALPPAALIKRDELAGVLELLVEELPERPCAVGWDSSGMQAMYAATVRRSSSSACDRIAMSSLRTGSGVFLTAFLPVATEPQPASARAPPASAVPVPVRSARRDGARPS